MQFLEILAMPRSKKWYGNMGVWEFEAKEVKEGETLE